MEKTFVRVHSAKDIIISVSLIVLGSVLVALPTGVGINVAGFFMIFTGLLLALFMRTGYKDIDSGERYQKKEHYFQQAMNSVINSVLENKPEAIDLAEEEKGNAVKLDIYYSRAAGKAYLQLFEYIPYKYEPCSKMYEHQLSRIEKLIK